MDETSVLAQLEKLSLATLGQHLWSLQIDVKSVNKDASLPSCCLCRLCELARKSYQLATGTWPTRNQVREAMEKWSIGKV